jgi:glycosyltransferase involved in cell wall biosynthesis
MYSIVIPYYNHHLFLSDLMNSLEVQESYIGEVIIINDGSFYDGITPFIKEYKGVLKNKIKVFHQINSGTANAINNGVRIARFKKIAILNSDDLFSYNKLERCDGILCNNEAELIFGGINFIDERGASVNGRDDTIWYQKGLESVKAYAFFPAVLISENIAVTSSNFVFTKNLFQKLNGFRDYRYSNDLDFLIRAVLQHKYFFDSQNIHVHYRYHSLNTIKESVELTTLEHSQIAKNVKNQFEILGPAILKQFHHACKIRGLSVD